MPMKLNDRIWKDFMFIDIFDIKGGFYNKKPVSEDNGLIPFLGAVDKNNGVTEYYSITNIEETSKTGNGKNEPLDRKIFPGNAICVTNNGSVGYAYYQNHPFTCSHDVNPLYLKNYKLNKEIGLFLIACIEKQRVCFQYSRKWRPTRMKKSKILLPVKLDNPLEPDYLFMQKYTKQILDQKVDDYSVYKNNQLEELVYEEVHSLSNKEWKSFFITDLFPDISRGKRLIKSNQIDGKTPYISSTAYNNGIDNYIGNEKKVRKFENCLTVANSGSVGSCFFHPYKFIASDHVTSLKNKKYNKFVYLFIATMITRLSSKYNFNREINDKRISREQIILPIDAEGNPDFFFMENYIKKIMKNKYDNYKI